MAAQAGGGGDSGQRAMWVRLMMLLRLRERFSCCAGFRVVLTRKGIDAMCKAYKKGRKKRRERRQGLVCFLCALNLLSSAKD